MPVKVTKVDGYRVSTPGGVKAKHTSKAKAERQANLLRGVEHGWKPTGKPARDKRKKAHGTDYALKRVPGPSSTNQDLVEMTKESFEHEGETHYTPIPGTSTSQVIEERVHIGNKVPKGF